MPDPYFGAQAELARQQLTDEGIPTSNANVFARINENIGAPVGTPVRAEPGDPPVAWNVTQTTNARVGNLWGWEFQVQHMWDMGFGIQANLTTVSGDVNANRDIVNEQFALFYPEKRPFFLEGADIFATRFNAIYSRNIADPDWGVKLTGKVGKDAIGVIVAQDSITNLLIPSSQSSALDTIDEGNLSTTVRYRRDLFGATTGGFFYTGREGDDYSNRLLGGDILFRWKDTEAARIELLGSQTQYPEEIAAEYPDIESEHMIVDIGMGRLANAPGGRPEPRRVR